jgi:uncharacterized protein YggU (UPF0235/DUF167 family)
MAATYTIRVKPGSSKGPLVEPQDDGTLVLYVRQRAIDGKANDAVIQLLSGYLKVAKSRIHIQRGHGSRVKQVEVGE